MKHKIVSLIALVLFCISVLFISTQDSQYTNKTASYLLISSIAFFYLISTIYGSFQIRANYFMNSINKGKGDGICLSFDDGPDPELTPKILKILRDQRIKAAFFVIGKKAEQHPELILAIDADGHIIANHTYDHSHSTGFYSTRRLTDDIGRCSDVIKRITGKSPLFFRPPFGVTNPRLAVVLKKLRLVSIGWTARSLDTVIESKKRLLGRVEKSIKTGAILLFHDTQKITMELLPDIIEYCKINNIKIVPLQELIKQNPYETE